MNSDQEGVPIALTPAQLATVDAVAEAMGKETQPAKKCDLDKVVQKELIALLKQAPLNPHVRTLIHAQILKPIPEEAKTFEEIKNWIELNIEPRAAQTLAEVLAQGRVDPPQGPEFHERITYSEQQWGNCHWSAEMSGTNTYSLSRQSLRDAAIEADGDWNGFCEQVEEELREQCNENNPDLDPVDGYDHSDYDTNGSDDSSVDFQQGLRTRLAQWMRANLPEQADELGL